MQIAQRLSIDATAGDAAALIANAFIDQAVIRSELGRSYLEAVIERDVRAIATRHRRITSESPKPSGLIPKLLARSAIASTSPEATLMPIFEPGRRGWLALLQRGPDGVERSLREWRRSDLLNARDAYRAAGRRAAHHAQFMQGLADALPNDEATVGDVFRLDDLDRLWNALTVDVKVTASLDRDRLCQLPDPESSAAPRRKTSCNKEE